VPLRGKITHVSRDEIYGWARFSTQPYKAPVIQAVVGGQVVAETYANLPYESFAHLGELVANCGFMLDISHVRSIGLREIFIVADGEILPGGAINCPPRASEQEVYIEQSGIAHVSIYRTGSYDVLVNHGNLEKMPVV
jgi:hypothetical protein